MKLSDLYSNTLNEEKKDKDILDDKESSELEREEKDNDADTKPDEVGDLEVEGDEDEDEDEDVGTVATKEGFKKSKRDLYAFGKTRPVTILTKNEELGGLTLTIQYVINPSTGAWLLQACLAGQSQEDMVEFDNGEDPSSLIKSLKKKKKITPHQAVQYLNPPADSTLKDD